MSRRTARLPAIGISVLGAAANWLLCLWLYRRGIVPVLSEEQRVEAAPFILIVLPVAFLIVSVVTTLVALRLRAARSTGPKVPEGL